MSAYSDSFSYPDGTSLEAGNAAWVKRTTNGLTVSAGRVTGSGNAEIQYHYNASLASDQEVTVTVYRASVQLMQTGATARHSASAATFYSALFATNLGGLALRRTVAGSSVQLGSTYLIDLAVGQSLTFTLSVSGNQVSLIRNGAAVNTVTEPTNSLITSGFSGLRLLGNGAGQIDAWSATDAAGAALNLTGAPSASALAATGGAGSQVHMGAAAAMRGADAAAAAFLAQIHTLLAAPLAGATAAPGGPYGFAVDLGAAPWAGATAAAAVAASQVQALSVGTWADAGGWEPAALAQLHGLGESGWAAAHSAPSAALTQAHVCYGAEWADAARITLQFGLGRVGMTSAWNLAPRRMAADVKPQRSTRVLANA